MKGISILVLLCFFFTGCGPDLGPKTQHPNKIEHTYGEEGDGKPGASAIVAEERDQAELYKLYRDIWQNPLEVIGRMGDLEGKTLADIGAGPDGYFSMMIAMRTKVAKVISIDIDPEAIAFMNEAKKLLPDTIQNRLETRLVSPENPNLKPGEADIILIVNTAAFFDDRVQYFKNLLSGLSENGKLVVIDYKMRKTPVGPPLDERIALGRMESDLLEAGYTNLDSDDRSLEFQYIVVARR